MTKKVTIRDYDADLCLSAVQKGIRRCDFIIASYFAVEILQTGWFNMIWKRLLICSAEDISDFVTAEVYALYESWKLINEGKSRKTYGRVLLVKAVYVLCHAAKSRDSDHLLNFVYEGNRYPSTTDMDKMLFRKDPLPIPDYAYDYHTEQGRAQGATKEEFFTTEEQALTPVNKNIERFIL